MIEKLGDVWSAGLVDGAAISDALGSPPAALAAYETYSEEGRSRE